MDLYLSLCLLGIWNTAACQQSTFDSFSDCLQGLSFSRKCFFYLFLLIKIDFFYVVYLFVKEITPVTSNISEAVFVLCQLCICIPGRVAFSIKSQLLIENLLVVYVLSS